MNQNTENTLTLSPVDPKMRKLEQLMEMKKRALFEVVRTIPVDKYFVSPSPNTWSVAQAANHLYHSERLSLAYLRKKMSYPDTIPPYHFRSWMFLGMLKFVLRTDIKLKAPASIDMWQSQDVYPVDELEVSWNQLRNELFSFIRQSHPRFKNMLVYNHPFAGRLTMKQMMIFMIEHIEHHTRQIRRIARSLDSR